MPFELEVLSGNIVVARWNGEDLDILDDALLPLYLQRMKNVDTWLASRAIDAHRSHSRLLKKALRLSEKDDKDVVLYSHGVTITDNYWVRAVGSGLTYQDVKFHPATFGTHTAQIALTGNTDAMNKVAIAPSNSTPELTNIGSFEKCWKHLTDGWWMYKSGTAEERFSELAVYRLAKNLGINVAEYRKQGEFIRTKDFTNGAEVNFEPAMSFIGDNTDYEFVHNRLQAICPNAIPDFVRMIFLDAVTNNVDRHENNFGILRDTQTGKPLGFAPLFDHNLALVSRNMPLVTPKKDLLVLSFLDFINSHPEYITCIPSVNEAAINKSIKSIDIAIRYPIEQVVSLVLSRTFFINSKVRNANR